MIKIKTPVMVLAVLLFMYNNSAAQQTSNSRLDSLIARLPKAKEDTSKANFLIEICQGFWGTNPPEGIKYGEQALVLSEKLRWKKGMAIANGVLGMNHTIISQYAKAKGYLQSALKLSEETNDSNGVAKSLGALGTINYYQGQFPQAIDYYLRSVRISERLGDKNSVAAGISNVGSIHMDLGKYPEALGYFNRAVKLNEETGFKIYLIANFENIGAVYHNLNDNDKAMAYHLKALAVSREINHLPGIATAYTNLAGTYLEAGDIDRVLDYGFKAIALNKELENTNELGSDFKLIGKAYLSIAKNNNTGKLTQLFAGDRTKCLQAAKKYADSSLAIAKDLESTNELSEAYRLMSEIQKLLGDTPGALESFEKYSAAKDSVFNKEEDKKLTQTAMQYEFDTKEAAARAEQEKKDTRQRNIRNSISAGLMGALIFGTVVFRQRNKIAKEKQRSEELLLNILPSEVAEELKTKGSAEAKQFDEVSVMFTDFKGFTQISEQLSPAGLVAEIHTCFKAFDGIITRHNIEKIKTIGDSYMCAGGLPASNKTHADDVVKAALEIQSFMKDHNGEREKKGLPVFEIRIGVNTGPVVAGIVGVKKFAYDIWGDTVNIASRMESSGESGKVNISGSTYELVKNKFTCFHRGKIDAKNKGEIDMYFVEAALQNEAGAVLPEVILP